MLWSLFLIHDHPLFFFILNVQTKFSNDSVQVGGGLQNPAYEEGMRLQNDYEE